MTRPIMRHTGPRHYHCILTNVSRLVLMFVILHTIITCFVEGSHYHKYNLNDYCDSSISNLITLNPKTNKTAILLRLKREFYKPEMNCTIRITAPPDYGLMAFVTKLKMRRFNAHKADKLEFSTPGHSLLTYYGMNQDVTPKKTILTKSDDSQLMIHFSSVSNFFTLAGKGFKIVVNLYTVVNSDQKCDTKLGLEFNCQNKLCIDTILECDGINNCQNNVDEIECDETSETKLSLYVFLATIAVMLFMVLIFMMKNKDKRKEIVRRMSRVYGNNPILYVMDNNSVSSNIFTVNNGLNNELEEKRPASLVKSKLSLSLPHGIDLLHNNIRGDIRII